MNKGINVGLVNGGVSGDTTAGGLSRLEWSLTDDIDGVVVALGANDMLRGLPPKHTKNNLSQIIQKLRDRDLPVLLVGIRSIENYGKDYKLEFENIYADLTDEYELILYPDLLSPILDQDNAQLEKYYQADKIHPNVDGVLLIVKGITPILIELIEVIKSKN
jgi:acyl-CoA thioesterase-1